MAPYQERCQYTDCIRCQYTDCMLGMRRCVLKWYWASLTHDYLCILQWCWVMKRRHFEAALPWIIQGCIRETARIIKFKTLPISLLPIQTSKYDVTWRCGVGMWRKMHRSVYVHISEQLHACACQFQWKRASELGVTFSRIDINPWLVEHLLILPVLVPQNCFDTKKQNEGSAAVHQNRLGGPTSQADGQRPHPHCHQQAKAHAGDVEYSLCYHKPHIEKQICCREERDSQQA